MEKVNVLLKFLRDGSIIKIKNNFITMKGKPNVGDSIFLFTKVGDDNEILIKTDGEEDYRLCAFKVIHVSHTSHLENEAFKNTDLIVSVSMDNYDTLKLIELMENKIKNNTQNKIKIKNKI